MKLLRKILPYLLFVAVVIVMIVIKVGVGAWSEYNKGAKALETKNFELAVIHFDRAIHWYLPFSGSVKKSIDGIKTSANQLSPEKKLWAWRVLRSAIYSVRHIRQPYKDVIDQADLKIAGLMALEKGEKGSAEFRVEQEKRLAQLKEDKGPKTGFALLAELGFFGWATCGFLFIFFGLKPQGGIANKKAAIFSGLFVLFYFLWIVGLAKA